MQDSLILASSSRVSGGGFGDHQILNSTFDFTSGGAGNQAAGLVGYQGLSDTTIASMPLEDLYKRIDKNMNKTNSFFDLRLTQAIKKS